MLRRFLGLPVALVLLLSACGSATKQVDKNPTNVVLNAAPIPPSGALIAAASGENQFGLELFHELASADNTAISPVSIANVLGMVLAGSQGETARQILDALHVNLPASQIHAAIGGLARALAQDNSNDVVVQQADRVWLDNGLQVLSSFSDELTRSYAAQLGRIDFSNPEAAADAMNAWAAQVTHGKITHFIDASQLQNAQMVLANAVYLDAKWAHPFDPSATAPAPFYVTRDAPVYLPTMHQSTTLSVLHTAGYTAVALPYAGKKLEMDLIMPTDLPSFERGFDVSKLNAIVNGMQPEDVDLSLPKFALRAHFPNLRQPLEKLGSRDAFEDADFSGMDGKRDLALSAVVHETFVHVDEQGTVAAAVTGGVVATSTAIATQPDVVRIDHPFVFVIRDVATGSVVFLGHVVNPGAASAS
jgi:serine protease inhibitor